MKVILKNLYNVADISNFFNVKSDLIIINYHKTLCFNTVTGLPSAVRALSRLGERTGSEILLHGRLDIEGDLFLSTLFFKFGELVGVSDCITHDNYTKARALRLFNICGIKSGVVIERDILFSGVDNCFNAGAKIIYHNALNGINKEYFGAYKSHYRLTNGLYLGLFSDCAVLFDGKLKLLEEGTVTEIFPEKTNPRFDRTFLRLSDEK